MRPVPTVEIDDGVFAHGRRTLRDLRDKRDEEAAMKPEVVEATYSILVRKAEERDVVTYSALSSMVPGLPVRGRAMIDTLIAVSERSWTDKGVLLPVLVVNAGRNGLPSTGFYESLTHYRPDDDQSDLARAARRERERVYAAYPIG